MLKACFAALSAALALACTIALPQAAHAADGALYGRWTYFSGGLGWS